MKSQVQIAAKNNLPKLCNCEFFPIQIIQNIYFGLHDVLCCFYSIFIHISLLCIFFLNAKMLGANIFLFSMNELCLNAPQTLSFLLSFFFFFTVIAQEVLLLFCALSQATINLIIVWPEMRPNINSAVITASHQSVPPHDTSAPAWASSLSSPEQLTALPTLLLPIMCALERKSTLITLMENYLFTSIEGWCAEDNASIKTLVIYPSVSELCELHLHVLDFLFPR